MLRSANLVDWEDRGAVLEVPEWMQGKTFWAPEIAWIDGLFYMYYSVGEGDRGHQIRVAIANRPEGPYSDAGRLTPHSTLFAIDAHVYTHANGENYLYYATDFLDGERPGTSLVCDRLVAPDQLEGRPWLVARASADWQRYERNRLIYDGIYDWHTLEGPSVVFHEGLIYVFYSGGNWHNASYGVDYVVSEQPEGPYATGPGFGERPRVMASVTGVVDGPGHNSVVLGPDGVTDYFVYHAWNREGTARLMRIDPLVWEPDGPRMDGPSSLRRAMVWG